MSRTDFLFAMPSFTGGMAAILDLGATLAAYNDSMNEELADCKALTSDWFMVGRDIRAALEQFDQHLNGKR